MLWPVFRVFIYARIDLFRSLVLTAFLFFAAACGGPPQYVNEGAESPAQLQLSSSSQTQFPEVVNGFTYTQSLEIRNLSGTVPADNIVANASLSSPFSFTGGEFPGTGGDCGDTLNPLSSCTVEIEINPNQVGDFSSNITFDYFDGLADQSLSIDLNATARDPFPANLNIAPSGAHDFGILAIGGFSDLDLIITNTGEETATAINFSGLLGSLTIPNNTCGASLTATSSCQLTVRFSPLEAQLYNQILSVGYNDGSAPQTINKAFSGEGRVAGFITVIQGLSFDYGIIHQGFSSNQTITIRNTGGGNVTSLNVANLVAPLSITSNNCPTTLVPTASCAVNVRYTPTITQLTDQDLSIEYFDGFSNQNVAPNFTGQGFANAPTLYLISPASSPSNDNTPTIQIGNLISGVRVRLYRTASCTIQTNSTIATGSTQNFSPTVAEGTHEFHARIEDESGNLGACSTALVNYQYDNTQPAAPSNIVFAQSYTTSSSSTPQISWNASASSDVVDYQVAVDSNPAGGNSEGGFTSKGNVTTATESGLSLTECNYYYASVQSVDHVGLISSSFVVSGAAFRYDSATPTTPSNLNEDGDGSTNNSATITWNASSDACGIDYYEIAISEDTNGNNVLDSNEIGNAIAFANVGNLTSHRFDGISLNNGIAHFTSIRAVDTSGRRSSSAVSDPWIVYDPSIELPDMIVWLDANDPSTITDNNGRDALDPLFNGSVQNWLDKSGSTTTHDFYLASGSSRPSYNSTNFTVDFNGSTTGMTVDNDNEINTATVDQRNITVAFRSSNDITSRQMLYEEGGNTRGMGIYISNGQIYCGFFNKNNDGDGIQPFVSVNAPLQANQNYFVTWVFDYTNYAGPDGPDGDLTCYVNGTSIGSTTTTSRLFAHSGRVGLGHIENIFCVDDGSCPSNDNHFLGNLYEVMLFNNAPDSSDVTNVHTYLDNKWN